MRNQLLPCSCCALGTPGDGTVRHGQVPALASAPLTKLEVGIVGADVVAGAQQALHHEGCAHGIEQAEVFGDPTLLVGGGKEGRRGVRQEGRALRGAGCGRRGAGRAARPQAPTRA